MKDTQGVLRHASIKTTADSYVQSIEQSVVKAVNSRTAAVLHDWEGNSQSLGIRGTTIREVIGAIRRSSAKLGEKASLSASYHWLLR